jgi:hypothetical protein
MRLYVAISHHGYGHLAQTAPVLNALAELQLGVELIIRSALPEALIAARVSAPFRYLDAASDCNFVMHDPMRIDSARSLAAYRAFHFGWEERVDAEAAALSRLGVDALFSNVGYLPLAAARRAGIPCAGMCSLNWADIFRHYLGHEPGADAILAQMTAAYAGADLFMRPEPAMPMADLANAIGLPPVARAGLPRPVEVRDRLGLAGETRLVLVAMGGIRYRVPVERWPELPGVVFLVPDDWPVTRPGFQPLAAAGLPFGDLLASVDALITKPGYGSYVEAAVAGVPVLTLPRPDWPESAYLNDWLAGHGRVLGIDETEFLAGDLAGPLASLWRLPDAPPVVPRGAALAAQHLAALVGWL